MPNARGTQPRQVRIDNETWADFDAAAKILGVERATLLREYIWWVLRRPGVEAPTRLTVEQADAIAAQRADS